ncbi:MAG: hypothetical protein L0Y74_05870 [candidate division Zixibacteria bacterium]|nr:hypothetical protein [candidate division Zixibacteria bacterium]
MYINLIEDLKKDHVSGASELAEKAAEAISAFCRESEGKSSQEFAKELSGVCQELIQAHRGIVPIFNLANSTLNAIRQPSADKTTNASQSALKYVSKFMNSSHKALQTIWQEGSKQLPKQARVMTLSSSGSVLGILRSAQQLNKIPEVFILESRPLFEGRMLARVLDADGISATLMVDAACGYIMPQIDLVLIGADSLSESSFVNKIGTQAVLLLANQLKKPVWLATEESKFILEQLRPKPTDSGNPDEIWPENHSKLKCLNPYFEIVPLDLVQKVITNLGTFTPSEIPALVQRLTIAPELSKV